MRLLLALLCAGVLAACSQTDSKDIRTSGVSADITVRATGDGADGVDVDAYLGAGNLNSVDLTGDDELTVTVAGRTKTLEHDESLNRDSYSTHLDLDGYARRGLAVTVALRRGAGDESAPASTVRLPSELSVTAPSSGSTQRRSAELIVGTNSGNGSLGVAWAGSCVQQDSLEVDSGEPLVIPAGRIQPLAAPASSSGASGGASAGGSAAPAPTSCALTLTVTRTVEGDLDEHYKEGSIKAVRTVKTAIRTVP